MRNRTFLGFDILFGIASVLLAFVARFEGLTWWPEWARHMIAFALVSVAVKIAIFWVGGLYSRLWNYASSSDLRLLVFLSSATVISGFLVGAVLLPGLGIVPSRLPFGVLALDGAMGPLLAALPRLIVRLWSTQTRLAPSPNRRRVLIAGAGAAGGMIVRELLANPRIPLEPVGFLDDDPGKLHKLLHGLPVLGPLKALPGVAESRGVEEVIIAMPSVPGRTVREVVQRAAACGVKTRTVPGLYEILSGDREVSALRQVEIQDLLRRDHVRIDLEALRASVEGRVVLVTGAGGSIGTELCRQLAALRPGTLVALGRGENSIFEIHQELTRRFPAIPVEPIIADVRDTEHIRKIFTHYRPQCVFHAAAHKHVPLMESNVAEAVLNNILGTRNVVSMAAEVGTERFVLVSTDKAVRPTSIMGATKRIAEQIVEHYAIQGHSGFVSVRFGNVLGSRGSVVPTFLRQIADGGPVTITHPEMTRYFMTIPEAVQLVLQACALGSAGEVFVLDMGEPVKVLDLAVDLIRLSGLDLDDIEIKFTNPRPGEKLYEELFFDESNATRTPHPKILKASEARLAGSYNAHDVTALIEVARAHAPSREVRRRIHSLVPDYQGVRDSGDVAARVGGGRPPLEIVRDTAAGQ